jgi:hypothetical protein
MYYSILITTLTIILLFFIINLPNLLLKTKLQNEYGFLAIGGRQGFIKK